MEMTKSPALLARYSYEKHGVKSALPLFEGLSHEQITASMQEVRTDIEAMKNEKRKAEKLAFLYELGGALEAY